MRSRLSPEGGPNQKGYFRSKNGSVFINAFILGTYYMKSYKKLNQKAQNREITTFTMGIRPKIVLICTNLYFFLKRDLCVIFTP